MKTIYFDSEFASFFSPAPIALGFVSEDGREFYSELTDTWKMRDCSEFVKDTVLPKLWGNEYQATEAEAIKRFGKWIEAFEESVQLACDSPTYDEIIIRKLLDKHGWPANLNREILWIDVDDFKFYMALSQVWDEYPEAVRHHALWDAKVLMLAARLREKYALLP